MAKSANQKLKILYLMKIFLEKTDETHRITMQEIIDAGEPVTEDGLVSFVAQGGDEQFYHILMMKEGVYRLERLDNMMNEQW